MSEQPGAAPAKGESLDRLEDELGVLLRRIRRVLGERARATHPDVSTPAYLLLSRLEAHGPRRSSDLSDELGIDKGAISRQVQQLSELGLLERSADPEDGRAHQLSISADGRRRIRATYRQRRELLEGRLEDWSETDLGAFVSMLSRYNTSLLGGEQTP